MSKPFCFFILSFLLAVSCEEDDSINSFPAEVRFDISARLLEDKPVRCIDFDENGNAVIGSGSVLYYQNGSELKDYYIGFPIIDLAVAPDQSVWIGTNGGGLCRFKDEILTWYTTTNAGFPRDVILSVEAAPDGKIWFASCAHMLGGLGVYDGKKFTFMTPENSPLNQNLITDIEIDDEGRVYIATGGTVTKTNIYRIKNNSWKCLGNEEGTFYWVMSFTIGPSDNIYLVEDFSLSSSSFNTNKLFRFENDEWENIDPDEGQKLSFFSIVKADKRNYCWLTISGEDGLVLLVFNGDAWVRSPEGLFPGTSIITTIEADNNNNIWVGTYRNGIYILNQ